MRQGPWAALAGLALAIVALGACSAPDADVEEQPAAEAPRPEAERPDKEPPSDGSSGASDAAGSEGGSVSSSATVSDGEDVRSAAEVRVGEILSDYDGVETSAGTQLSVPSEVLFDVDDDQLRPDAQATIDEVVEVLAFYEGAPVEVVGHTDSQGPADYNQGLSERRAASVAAAIEAAGIDRARLTVSGRGETDPVATNDTEAGRQANRRVELLVRGVRIPDADG
jgi:outer membrane protein OmpA-like peptidoglycan-associated protein